MPTETTPTRATTPTNGLAWGDLRAAAVSRLGSEAEARWLLEEVAGKPRPFGPVSETARIRFDTLLDRRAAGEPLQYIVGSWAFRALQLRVDRRVLIPRPETEQVVEVALGQLDRMRPDPLYPVRAIVVDLGTGSGAMALALATERIGVDVWATDLSDAALAVAASNLAEQGRQVSGRVRFRPGSWWAALPDHLRGRIDLAVSNPPYVATAEMSDLDSEVVDWEPRMALEAGPTGLEAVEQIVDQAGQWLRPGGALVIEIAPHQSEAVMARARSAGLTRIEVRPDLAGRDRCLVAQGTVTVVLDARGEPPPAASIAAAVEALREGDIIGIPTDTVYGLAADPWHSGAADRLFHVKGRPRHVELPVLVASQAQALEMVTAVPACAMRLMARFWPGALTVVLPRREDVSADLGDDDETIGLRCPDHPVPLAVCRALGPIATTSANRHGSEPATGADAVAALPGVALVLDAGPCDRPSSTVVDATGEVPKLLRLGSISWEDILSVATAPLPS